MVIVVGGPDSFIHDGNQIRLWNNNLSKENCFLMNNRIFGMERYMDFSVKNEEGDRVLSSNELVFDREKY